MYVRQLGALRCAAHTASRAPRLAAQPQRHPARPYALVHPRARAHAAEPLLAAPQHCRGRGAVRHGPARGAADPDRGDGQRRHHEAGARPYPNLAPRHAQFRTPTHTAPVCAASLCSASHRALLSVRGAARGSPLESPLALPCTCCRPRRTCAASASRRRQRRARQAEPHVVHRGARARACHARLLQRAESLT